MNRVLILIVMSSIGSLAYGQTELNIEYGREVVWQYGRDGNEPYSIALVGDHMISKNLGISVGFRKSLNNKIGPSNASNASSQIDFHYAIREFGNNNNNEIFFGSIYKIHSFSFRLALGYVFSSVNAENVVVQRAGDTNELLDEQILSVIYDSKSFWRSSAMIRYTLFSKGGFGIVPFVEYMHDFRSSSNQYSVATSDALREPFSQIDVLTDFRSDTKSIYLKPNYFNIGVALQYSW